MRSAALKSWEIAPESVQRTPPAYFLRGQLERITHSPFSPEDPRRCMYGGNHAVHAATEAFLVKDARLIDGVLYKGKSCTHLHPRLDKIPNLRVEQEFDHAALYCTPGGNRYFGQWLMDDCVTYELAVQEGPAVTTNQPKWLHTDGYEDWLEMHPTRVKSAYFKELVLFADVGQNLSKHRRRNAMKEKLLRHVPNNPHPGIFILRKDAGERRVLVNELEIAARLAASRGFRVIDPLEMEVPEIVAACAGARVVVGIEGSQLLNGIQVLGPGDNILVLQPPDRFVWVLKHLADRDGQNFGFVVGTPCNGDFYIDPDEVERTLDLFPLH